MYLKCLCELAFYFWTKLCIQMCTPVFVKAKDHPEPTAIFFYKIYYLGIG